MNQIEIKDLFNKFNEFIGKDSCYRENYCIGEICYDSDTHQIDSLKRNELGNYEDYLKQFLLRKYDSTNQFSNSLLIIGPIGSGKSTAIRNQIINIVEEKKNKECKNSCPLTNEVISIDFNSVNDIPTEKIDDDELFKVQLEESFNLMSDSIYFYEDPFKTFDVITRFIPWLASRKGIAQKCSTLSRFLAANRGDINSISLKMTPSDTLIDDLNKKYQECIAHMPANQLTIYFAYKQRWIWESESKIKCSCKCMVADNIDHLHPNVQRKMVETLRYVSDILHTKMLIPVRPVTITRANAGNYLIERRDHCAPRIESALINKIDWFLRESSISPSQEKLLQDLKNTLDRGHSKSIDDINNTNLLCLLINSTSGMSIRYAIRNIHNYFESPQALNALKSSLSPFNIKPSDLARGYFCSSSKTIMNNSFVRLDSSLSGKGWSFSLVKPRILDYLHRESTESTRRAIDLFEFLDGFGYSQKLIKDSLNDLMLPSRPLIWNKSGFRIGPRSMESRISLTPIGMGYIDHLFGEYTYEEVLLGTNSSITPSPIDVRNSHFELTKQSLLEIDLFISNKGVSLYKQVYGSDSDGIISRHWKNLKSGLKRRLKSDQIDFRRENYIKSEIQTLVSTWENSI